MPLNMIKDFRIAGNRPLTHFLFWLIYWLVSGFIWGYCFDHTNYYQSAYTAKATELPFVITAVYLNMYFLLPGLVVRRKYFLYLLAMSMLLLPAAFLIRLVQVNYLNVRYPVSWDGNNVLEFYFIGRISILSLAPALILTTIIKLLQYWVAEQKTAGALFKEKTTAELNYLKAQVHPHFLFNTLNNLYSLTLNKSDHAPEVVLKLASLMTYTLYDAQANKIALEKELAHIRNYIDLEKIRYGKRLDVSLNVLGDTKHIYMPPLILIPFVENAFKHGASNETGKAWITIDLKVMENRLAVKIENSKNGISVVNNIAEQGNGIGLQNVKRRLALLYPDQYQLSIDDDKEYYAVDLKLSLSGN
jgi:sensor histidine kinase YesM